MAAQSDRPVTLATSVSADGFEICVHNHGHPISPDLRGGVDFQNTPRVQVNQFDHTKRGYVNFDYIQAINFGGQHSLLGEPGGARVGTLCGDGPAGPLQTVTQREAIQATGDDVLAVNLIGLAEHAGRLTGRVVDGDRAGCRVDVPDQPGAGGGREILAGQRQPGKESHGVGDRLIQVMYRRGAAAKVRSKPSMA